MKKYNNLVLIAFILNIGSVAIPFAGIILPYISIFLLVIANQNKHNISNQYLHFLKTSIIINYISLFIWTFSIVLTIFSKSKINKDICGFISVAAAAIVTFVAFLLYNLTPKKEDKKYDEYAKLNSYEVFEHSTVYTYDVAPYGYAFMLKLAQKIIDCSSEVLEASTAELAGMPETNHFLELISADKQISDCQSFQKETGVISLGIMVENPFFKTPLAIKITMFNQTGCLYFNVLNRSGEHDLDLFANVLVRSALYD